MGKRDRPSWTMLGLLTVLAVLCSPLPWWRSWAVLATVLAVAVVAYRDGAGDMQRAVEDVDRETTGSGA